ncbi:MAG: ABC transporter substrate-binding protein [Deltaproteobacteria bacterium]|nr:ABC transporter substrate-binding protein [Deltaproteobacteria bacterium]
MKTIIGKFCCMAALVALALLFAGVSDSKAGVPMETMKGVVGEVFSTLQSYPVTGPPDNMTKRRQKIREIIDTHFDSVEMSQRALGKYWKEISEEQRKEFTQLFY